MSIPVWFKAVADLFFPRLCPVCQRALHQDEEEICTYCLHHLPRTNYHLDPQSPMAQLFWGKVPVERCAAYFYFSESGEARRLIHHIKYHQGKSCGLALGRIFAHELADDSFFTGIDALVPVPLHPAKQRRRGYNQSEWIAMGISQATGIEVCTEWIVHTRDSRSQTQRHIYERWEEAHDAYKAVPGIDLAGRNILLIDDVVTTGATLQACAQALHSQGEPKVNCLTLAAAQ